MHAFPSTSTHITVSCSDNGLQWDWGWFRRLAVWYSEILMIHFGWEQSVTDIINQFAGEGNMRLTFKVQGHRRLTFCIQHPVNHTDYPTEMLQGKVTQDVTTTITCTINFTYVSNTYSQISPCVLKNTLRVHTVSSRQLFRDFKQLEPELLVRYGPKSNTGCQ